MILISERKSNFELLRIISMMMIVGAHYVHHGVIQTTELTNLKIWN